MHNYQKFAASAIVISVSGQIAPIIEVRYITTTFIRKGGSNAETDL